MIKESTCSAGAAGAAGFDSWVGKIPWRGHGYSLQYSFLENPMDRGARWATIHGITKSQTQLKQLSYTVSWGSTITTQHLEINALHAAKAWDSGRLLMKGRVILIWMETCSEPTLFSCPTVLPRVALCVEPDVVPGHHVDLKPHLCLRLALECVGLAFIVPEPWGEEKAKAKQTYKPRIFYPMCVLVVLLSLTLWDPTDCSLPGSSVHRILQARILEWVTSSFSRVSSQPRDQTQVSYFAGRCFTVWATILIQSKILYCRCHSVTQL